MPETLEKAAKVAVVKGTKKRLNVSKTVNENLEDAAKEAVGEAATTLVTNFLRSMSEQDAIAYLRAVGAESFVEARYGLHQGK